MRLLVILLLGFFVAGCAPLYIPHLEESARSKVKEVNTVRSYVPRRSEFVSIHPSEPDRIVAPFRRSVHHLRKFLFHQDAAVRTHAATYLGGLGHRARHAIPELGHALRRDNSPWVRRAAAKSLGKIGGQRAREELRYALNDGDKWVVHSVRRSLNRLGH